MSFSHLQTEEEELERLGGLFIGQLNDEELELFNRMVKEGKAARSYAGMTGFMGLGRVVVLDEQAEEA